jgi:quinol-cytochrome oxidoreductase complex cytochrome b subunit
MGGSIVVLFFLPWLDTSKVRSLRFRPIMRWWFWILVADVIVLGYVGANPPEGFWIVLGQIATFYYFLHFLVITPLTGKLERPLPQPASIAEAVLGEKA